MIAAAIRWILILAVMFPMVYFALISHDPLPDHRLIVGINDIILHAGAFGLLAIVALSGNRWFWTTFAGLAALAVTVEAAQMLQPEREAGLRDLVSSLAGVAAGALVVVFLAAMLRFFSWTS